MRIDHFWNTEILPLRSIDSLVLIVSHGGVISFLQQYLMGHDYSIHESFIGDSKEARNYEVKNCSITEITLGEGGPGKFMRIGDADHVVGALGSMYSKQLENSIG